MKTVKEKLQKGTLREHRLPGKVGGERGELVADAYVARNEEMLQYFELIVEHLREHDALKAVDSMIVSQAAFYLWLFKKSVKGIQENGPVVLNSMGTYSVSPDVRNAKDATDRLLKLFQELGMSPRAREKVVAFQMKDIEEDDVLAKLLS